MVYGLLPEKTTETYIRVFSVLKDKFEIVINNFKCDYEKAQINARYENCNPRMRNNWMFFPLPKSYIEKGKAV